MSETAKWRHLTAPYCTGNGLDLGSGGDPVVPTAITVDLPLPEAAAYGTTHWGGAIHLQGSARQLYWFQDGCLDFVYSSHLLEDFADWDAVLLEWMRVIAPGGRLVLLVPEMRLWAQAVEAGQCPNCAHAHEFQVGELSAFMRDHPGWRVIEDRLAASGERTTVDTPEYTILFVVERQALS